MSTEDDEVQVERAEPKYGAGWSKGFERGCEEAVRTVASMFGEAWAIRLEDRLKPLVADAAFAGASCDAEPPTWEFAQLRGLELDAPPTEGTPTGVAFTVAESAGTVALPPVGEAIAALTAPRRAAERDWRAKVTAMVVALAGACSADHPTLGRERRLALREALLALEEG